MKFRKKNSLFTGINMTPVIDIVFQLLTFFMITSSVIKTSAINVDLPSAQTSDPQPNRQAVITLFKNGVVMVNEQEIPFNKLGIKIRELFTNDMNLVVTIQGDKDVPYDIIIQTMDIVRIAGVKRMSLATTLKEPKKPKQDGI